MKRRPYAKDFHRKVRIAFYPKQDKDLEEIRPYFSPSFFHLKGVLLFEDINTKVFDQVPDLIVCTDNFKILSNKIEKYIYYISLSDYLNHPKQVCIDIRKQAYHNYIDKIKGQIENEIGSGNHALSCDEAVRNIIDLFDLKNTYLKDHSIRVMHYASLIGKELGLNKEKLKTLKYTSLLHDVGKLAIPSRVLDKPADLMEYEQQIFKYHTSIGAYLLDFPIFLKFKDGMKDHHERIDGKGYGKKKGSENISLNARIIAIADTFDILTTSNFYQKRLTYEEAIDILKKYSFDIHSKVKLQPFDPEIVRAFLTTFSHTKPYFIDMNTFLDNSLKDTIIVEKP